MHRDRLIMADTQKKRRWWQALAAAGFNIWIPSFFKGGITQSASKGVCVPVLNCYSCPSAVGACPIGALQNSLGSLRLNLSMARRQFGLYVVGTLGVVGSLVGRIPCGWLCPFGLVQELLYKIPGRKFQVPKFLTYMKYVVLGVLVVALPLLVVDAFGGGSPWFCKWICPAGTIEAGIPLAIINSGVRGQLGLLFTWKAAILAGFLVWMILSMRPFCRTTCPLGAILGLFNKTSLFRMSVDEETCTRCDLCRKECPVNVRFYETPNSPDCIRCLKCEKVCPFGSISHAFPGLKPEKAKEATST
jgi:ferredoxin-type protein NapH